MNQKTLLSLLLVSVPLLSISGCANTEDVTEREVQASSCAILESGKWHAWLDRYQQKEGEYRLNVVGEVTLPNPGFNLTWSVESMDEMHPPGLNLLLTATPQEGSAIQVLSEFAVDYKMSTSVNHYRQVSVFCGNKRLTLMPDVTLTD